jgi:hypothetical protein
VVGEFGIDGRRLCFLLPSFSPINMGLLVCDDASWSVDRSGVGEVWL